jgi:DNA-binding IscR family transcriptional regulator
MTMDAGKPPQRPERAEGQSGRDQNLAPVLLHRVKDEFEEMRGFSPTLAQAARLFHLPLDECERVLQMLVQEGFLRRGTDGTYRLASE